jgi:tetratricopeptide (TPR) repeat protein
MAAWRKVLEARPPARKDFQDLGFPDAASLLAMFLMPRPALLAMAAGAALNEDDRPRLEFSAPRNLGRETGTLNYRLMKRFAVTPRAEDADPEHDPGGRLAILLAHGYLATRDPAQARTWADRGLQRRPLDGSARLLRARIALEDGRLSEAAEDLQAVVAAPGPLPEGTVEAIRCMETEDAAALLETLRARHPGALDVRIARTDVLVRQGRFREAEGRYRELAALLPVDRRIPFGLGRALLGREQYAQALEAFDAAGQRGEMSGEFHAQRGETLMRLARYAEAADAFRLALRDDVEQGREVLALDAGNVRAWDELHKLGRQF